MMTDFTYKTGLASLAPEAQQEWISHETKRIQDHAFALADQVRAGRKMLRALDHYWASQERNRDWEVAWWSAYERWRDRFEAGA